MSAQRDHLINYALNSVNTDSDPVMQEKKDHCFWFDSESLHLKCI